MKKCNFKVSQTPLNSTHSACAEFISDFKLQHIKNSALDDFIMKLELF